MRHVFKKGFNLVQVGDTIYGCNYSTINVYFALKLEKNQIKITAANKSL